jgi:tetratricopeptide (TPR) repeat protein
MNVKARRTSAIRKLLVLLFLLFNSLVSVADDTKVAKAQKLLEENRPSEAYQLLKPLENERAGEVYFDYILGLAALDSGKFLEAVFALERVVDLSPSHGPARAELARAYFRLGDTEDAKTEFTKVSAMDLPEEARQTIERYMSTIDLFHDRTRTVFRPWIQFSAGYDTNANGSTDEKGPVTIPIAPGIPFFLGGTANSPIGGLGAGVRFTSPINLDLGISLFGRIGVNHRITIDEADFASTAADGQLGVLFKSQRHSLNLAIDTNMAKIDGNPVVTNSSDLETFGFSSQYQFSPTETSQISAFGQYAMVRYPDQRIRDVNKITLGMGYGKAFPGAKWSPIVFGSAFGGTEDTQSNVRGAHFGKDFWGVRLGASALISEKHTTSVNLTYQRSYHASEDPIFLAIRDDDFFEVVASYRYQHDKNWSISPQVTLGKNKSNIVLNEYDRLEFLLTFRNDF